MKYAILGFCLVAAACSQPLSPSAPSIAGGGSAQTQAKGGANHSKSLCPVFGIADIGNIC